MIYVFIIATIVSIILLVKKEKGSIIGILLWLVTLAVWVLNSFLQNDYLIIALGTIWTILVLVWIFMINRGKERD